MLKGIPIPDFDDDVTVLFIPFWFIFVFWPAIVAIPFGILTIVNLVKYNIYKKRDK